MAQTVGRRSADPAASLASFFTQRSKRNGEIVEVHAREVFSDNMELSAFELTIQVIPSAQIEPSPPHMLPLIASVLETTLNLSSQNLLPVQNISTRPPVPPVLLQRRPAHRLRHHLAPGARGAGPSFRRRGQRPPPRRDAQPAAAATRLAAAQLAAGGILRQPAFDRPAPRDYTIF